MLITRSLDQLVAQYKLRMALQPTLQTSVVGYAPGFDIDPLLRVKIRDRYYSLLDTADPRLLPVENLADEATMVYRIDNVAEVTLPDRCRRLVAVRLSDWSRDAVIVTDPNSPEALLQTSEYSRSRLERPVALLDGRRLILYGISSPSTSTLVTLLCVPEPPADDDNPSLTLDESLLPAFETIPFAWP